MKWENHAEPGICYVHSSMKRDPVQAAIKTMETFLAEQGE
jgi:hypothetical protein